MKSTKGSAAIQFSANRSCLPISSIILFGAQFKYFTAFKIRGKGAFPKSEIFNKA